MTSDDIIFILTILLGDGEKRPVGRISDRYPSFSSENVLVMLECIRGRNRHASNNLTYSGGNRNRVQELLDQSNNITPQQWGDLWEQSETAARLAKNRAKDRKDTQRIAELKKTFEKAQYKVLESFPRKLNHKITEIMQHENGTLIAEDLLAYTRPVKLVMDQL